MKFLCVCQYGHSRSACLVRVLHQWQHEAVAVGVGTARPELIGLLAEWADVIVTMQPAYADAIDARHRHKTRVFDVGPDVWSNPYHPGLFAALERMAREAGYAPPTAKGRR